MSLGMGIFYHNEIPKQKIIHEFNGCFWDNIRMPKKVNWVWQIYFYVYLTLAVATVGTFFDAESDITFYYHALIGFDRLFFLPYVLNLAAVLFTALTVIPFYCFVFNQQFLSSSFWHLFFILRLSFDLTGHSYEFKAIKSLFYHDPSVALHFIFLVLVLYVPSYIALFLQAAKQNTNK